MTGTMTSLTALLRGVRRREAGRRRWRRVSWAAAVGVGTLALLGLWQVVRAPLGWPPVSIPFAVVTSWVSLGAVLARLGICAVPEELDPPPVVVAAGHALGWRPQAASGAAAGFVAIDAPAAPSVD